MELEEQARALPPEAEPNGETPVDLTRPGGGPVDINADLQRRIVDWNAMSRWEKSELGRDLRRKGFSYGEIMELIDVKKSTLATWCKDVRLTEEQIRAMKDRTGQVTGLPRDTNWKRRLEIAELRAVARSQVPELATNPLWVAGLVLYWAEGAKTRNHLSMANTDPRALRLFVDWCRVFLRASAQFSMQLHLHEGNDERAARDHWRSETGLAYANFHKTFIKAAGTGHRKNHLQHGICTVKMRRGSDPWNIAMEWIDAYSIQLGLDSPRG